VQVAETVQEDVRRGEADAKMEREEELERSAQILSSMTHSVKPMEWK